MIPLGSRYRMGKRSFPGITESESIPLQRPSLYRSSHHRKSGFSPPTLLLTLHWRQTATWSCASSRPAEGRMSFCLLVLVAELCLTFCDPMNYIAHQAPPALGFPRQEYWSGKNTSPGELADPGIKPRSRTLQADSLPSEPLEIESYVI